jgi:hypothetical protein
MNNLSENTVKELMFLLSVIIVHTELTTKQHNGDDQFDIFIDISLNGNVY